MNTRLIGMKPDKHWSPPPGKQKFGGAATAACSTTDWGDDCEKNNKQNKLTESFLVAERM